MKKMIAVLSFVFAAFGSDKADVLFVKEGILAGYKSTTVGKAFDGTFQNPKRESFQTPKGATIVQFTGTIQPDVLRKAGFEPSFGDAWSQCRTTLNMQAAIDAENEAYRIADNKSIDALNTAAQGLNYYRSESRVNPSVKHEPRRKAGVKSRNPVVEKQQPTAEAEAKAERYLEFKKKADDETARMTAITAVRDERKKEHETIMNGYNAKMVECVKPLSVTVPVKFQFLLRADRKGFELSALKMDCGKGQSEILEFIYH